MIKKTFKPIVRPQRKPSGFTLLELLVVVAMGWIIISALLYFIVQLTGTDRREFALSQTQQEMSQALDYISSELKEAVYVYEGECLGRNPGRNPTAPNYCSGLANYIPFETQNVTPILAFWKVEALPYENSPELPDNIYCNRLPSPSKEECTSLIISRSSYTLVVYGLKKDNPDNLWDGPARITRYELREFEDLSNLKQTPGYRKPTESSFSAWPLNNDGTAQSSTKPIYEDDVLVDLVDFTANDPAWKSTPSDNCPNYSRTPADTLNTEKNGSFYACVKPPLDAIGRSQLQDVTVYLRGNAFKRAGATANASTSFLPKVQTQVQIRSAFGVTPPQLSN